MPEGPEIRRAADALSGVLTGVRIEAVYFGLAHLEPFACRLVGVHVDSVETRGKAMLVRFENDQTLYSHNQLYGRWYVTPRGKLPGTRRSLRVGLHTVANSALLYSASEIEVLTGAELAGHRYLSRLGPDVLDPALEWRLLAARLQLPAFRNRSLGGLYLDQGFLAGVGNYLRSEILFFAGLSHQLKAGDLARIERNRLARETLRVSHRAYTTGGITNPPAWASRSKRRGARPSDSRFAVYGRADRPCHRCQHPVSEVVVASRRLYFCPNCQTQR